MAILRAYFDASGTKKDPQTTVLTVAGYIAQEDDWTKFETRWPEALREFGLTAFHFKDFAHFKGEFTSWKDNEAKRRKLIQRLSQIIGDHTVRGFSITVNVDSYETANRLYVLPAALQPYPLAASAAIQNVEDWHQTGDRVAYVFEKGDADQQGLLAAIGFFEIDIPASPIFLCKKWRNPDGGLKWCYPFQACYFLAYEHRKIVDTQHQGKFTGELRGSLSELMRATDAMRDECWYFWLPTYIALHCCPVKSRIESIGWGHRGIRFGSRMAGVPVKGAFFRIA